MTDHSMVFLKDLMAGTMAGMSSKLMEYPLDTVKVRLQDANTTYNGPLQCISRMLREEGMNGFYKGVTAPVVGCMLETAILFAVYGRITHCIRQMSGQCPTADLTVLQYGMSGCVAGVAVSSVLIPIELVKCKIQVQDTLPPQQRIYHGVWHCARKTLIQEGIRGLYRGGSPTIAREAAGGACWYASYEWMKYTLCGDGTYSCDLPVHKVALAGGVAGFCDWTAFFPADVVATRIRVDPSYAKHTLWQGLRDVYKEGGVKALYSGWSITVLRAVPAHALLFVTYEKCKLGFDQIF
jgi:solute carrier family 25 carnitine/acylcarnitine transporter 20/29